MDFLGDVAAKKDDFAPGDSFLSTASEGKKTPAFEPSDVPGFVHPVVDGTPDTTQYVTTSDAEQSADAGVEAPSMPREQALAVIAKADGIQNPTAKEGEATLAKKKAKPKAVEPVSERFEYPV